MQFLSGGYYEGQPAFDPALGRLFVPDVFGGVSVINTTTNARIAVVSANLSGPVAALYDPQTDLVYVSDAGNQTVAELNPHTLTVTGFLVGPSSAGPMMLLNSSGFLLLADNAADTVYLADPLGTTWGAVQFGTYVTSMAWDDATDMAVGAGLLSSNGTADLWAYDDTTGFPAFLSYLPSESWVAYDAADARFVLSNTTDGISVYPGSNVTTTNLGAPSFTTTLLSYQGPTTGIGYDPVQKATVVIHAPLGNPSFIDFLTVNSSGVVLKSEMPTNSFFVGPPAVDLANSNLYFPTYARTLAMGATSSSVVSSRTYSFQSPSSFFSRAPAYVPTTRQIWIQDISTGTMHIVSEKTHGVLANFFPGTFFSSLLYDPAVNELLGTAGSSVVAFNVTTHNQTSYTFGTGAYGGMTYDPLHGTIVVDDGQFNTLRVVNATSFALLANLSVSSTPYGGTFDPAAGTVVVALFGGNISIVRGSSLVKEITGVYSGDQVVYDPATQTLMEPVCTGASIPVLDALTYAPVGSLPGVYQQTCDATGAVYDPADHSVFDLGHLGGIGSRTGEVINTRNQVSAYLDDTFATVGANVGGCFLDPVSNQVVVVATDGFYWINP